jgi:nucleoside-diphosphate-sugar epimerase
MKTILGIQRFISLEEGLSETMKWYQEKINHG